MKTTRLTSSLPSSLSAAAGVALAFALLLLPLAPAASAQDTDRTDASMTNTPPPTYVIRNARVVTVSGADIEGGGEQRAGEG